MAKIWSSLEIRNLQICKNLRNWPLNMHYVSKMRQNFELLSSSQFFVQ